MKERNLAAWARHHLRPRQCSETVEEFPPSSWLNRYRRYRRMAAAASLYDRAVVIMLTCLLCANPAEWQVDREFFCSLHKKADRLPLWARLLSSSADFSSMPLADNHGNDFTTQA